MPSRVEQPHTLPACGSPALVADMGSRLAVIVTHPWGPLGGSMHNNVVAAAVLYFQRLHITTLRFDFCGTQIGRGHRQVRQVMDAANYLLSGKYQESDSTSTNDDDRQEEQNQETELPPPSPYYILLVGYSYGSLISASASASIPRCVGVISIAPPLAVKHWLLCFNGNYHMEQAQARTNLPRLLILGSRDNFTSEKVFNETVESFPSESTTGAILKDADHFFRRREKDLMAIIGQWLMTTYEKELGGKLKWLGRVELVAYMDVQSDVDKGAVAASYDCNMLDSACQM